METTEVTHKTDFRPQTKSELEGRKSEAKEASVSSAPSVYEAEDYRAFLKAYYEYRKAQNPRFSFQVFSNQLGFRARSHLQLIISRDRNLGLDKLEHFAAVFPGDARGFQFFKKLVRFDQATSPAERAALAKEIRKEKAKRGLASLSLDLYELYSEWFHIPILFMAELPEFEPDAEWIRKQLLFPVSKREVSATMHKLREWGLWVEKDGRVALAHARLETYAERDRARIRDHYRSILGLAQKATAFGFGERYVSGSLLVLGEADFAAMTDEIHRFKQNLFAKYVSLGKSATEQNKRVYQLAMTAFPFTGGKS